jgi:hypothetical protein
MRRSNHIQSYNFPIGIARTAFDQDHYFYGLLPIRALGAVIVSFTHTC